MTIFFQVFCAVFSGILTAIAIPNEIFHFGSALFAFFALVPLYMAAKSARSYKNAALIFALDALTTHLLSSYWLANFKNFAAFTLGASAFGTACIEAMAGCVFFFPFAKNQGRRFYLMEEPQASVPGFFDFSLEPYSPLHFALVRVIYEWAKSTGFLAYPWGVLSMAAFNSRILAQSADIFGVWGLTFLMAYFAAVFAQAVLCFCSRRKDKIFVQKARFRLACNAKCALALLLSLACYGIFRLNEPSAPVKTLNAVLVQQNADPWASTDDIKSIETSMRLSEEGINAFRQEGQAVDLVVWSEAVLRYALPQSTKRYSFYPQKESLFDFIQRMKAPFIIGGPYSIDSGGGKFANAALVFSRTSAFSGWYGKSHLVPFAEVVPGVEYEWARKIMKRIAGFSNGWTAGGTYTLFDFNAHAVQEEKPAVKIISIDNADEERSKKASVRVAVPICFEDAFPDICGPFNMAGAEVFMNITDDSWSKTNSAEWQHFAVATFRAIEYRTTLVRSTNAGVTAVVDNKGRILQSLPLFEEGCLNAKIPIYPRRQTVYAAYGNWFVRIALAITAVLAVLTALRFKKPPLKKLIQAELLKIDI